MCLPSDEEQHALAPLPPRTESCQFEELSWRWEFSMLAYFCTYIIRPVNHLCIHNLCKLLPGYSNNIYKLKPGKPF